MDGAYIPDSAIVDGPTYAFEYSTTNISCTYPQRAIGRNKDKRDILEYLLNQTMIKSFPYEMYFMSCNLDHALYNEINLDKNLKQEYADEFYEKFIGKEYLFPAFLESDVVNGVPNNMGHHGGISKKVYILWRGILIYISTLKHILIQMDYCNSTKYKNSNRL